MSNGCLRALSVVALLAGGALLLVRSACSREVSGDGPPPPESKGPWAVNGVRLGATEAECRALLGDADEPGRDPRAGRRSFTWRTPVGRSVRVAFDASGAAEITGDTLTDAAGSPEVGSGATVADVRAILPHADEREITAPTGNGVISISRTRIGTTFRWKDGAARYSIVFGENGLSYVHVTK